MQDTYAYIRFITTNYTKLQGLRAIPPGILAVFVTVWSLSNQGSSTDLSAPILVAILTALLYWLIDRYYNRAFGQVKQTSQQRRWEFVSSAGFGMLALLTFVLDTTELLPISTLGLVLAASFFEYVWRANRSEWKKVVLLLPENIIASILIVIISILPLFGISWWHTLGIKSQIVAIFLIFGIVIIVTGILGHLRMVRTLSAAEAKSDANTL
jgi:hypothetical protein